MGWTHEMASAPIRHFGLTGRDNTRTDLAFVNDDCELEGFDPALAPGALFLPSCSVAEQDA